MKCLVFGLFILFFSYGCQKEINESSYSDNLVAEDTPIKVKLLWNTPLTDGKDYIQGKTGLHFNENHVVFAGSENGSQILKTLDVETGTEINKWSPSMKITGLRNYKYNNQVVLAKGLNVSNFNLNTGEPDWTVSTDHAYFVNSFGLQNIAYIIQYIYDEEGRFHSCIYEADLEDDNEPQVIVCPNYTYEYALATGYIGGVNTVVPFVENNDTLLFVGFHETQESTRTISYWGLYNISKEIWEFDKIQINDEEHSVGMSYNAFFYQNKFYFTCTNSIQCWDRFTGEKVWQEEFGNSFGFSSIELIEKHNLIVGSNHDKNTYCLDATTGNRVWTKQVSGASSRVHYQDDVIYIAGGSSGKLHAIDVVTGEDIWEIKAPDLEYDSQAYFSRQINGIPAKDGEKGKIFVSSYLTAYCYEAVN